MSDDLSTALADLARAVTATERYVGWLRKQVGNATAHQGAADREMKRLQLEADSSKDFLLQQGAAAAGARANAARMRRERAALGERVHAASEAVHARAKQLGPRLSAPAPGQGAEAFVRYELIRNKMDFDSVLSEIDAEIGRIAG